MNVCRLTLLLTISLQIVEPSYLLASSISCLAEHQGGLHRAVTTDPCGVVFADGMQRWWKICLALAIMMFVVLHDLKVFPCERFFSVFYGNFS